MKKLDSEKELINKLIFCNKKYRIGEPILSDYEYDKMVDELRERFPESKWFKKGVNDEIPEKEKEELTFPMFSLDKCKSLEEIKDWLRNKIGKDWADQSVIITPKFDGLSVQKQLRTGKSWTRGNGLIGRVCTPQMNKIYTLDPDFNSNFKTYDKIDREEFFVRGEVLFTNKMWNAVQEQYPDYKSSRNTATGWINGDYKEGIPYYLLSYICYEILNFDLDKEDQLNILNNQVNFTGCPYKKVSALLLNENYLEKLFFSWSKIFPIDGLVIDINDKKYRIETEPNGNPTYSRAYKNPSFSEKKVTKIIKVERNINRNGVITPILHIEPIELSGATIKKVNGINMSYVYDWGLIPGTVITVKRSGEVIPKVVEVEGIKIPFKEDFKTEKDYKREYSIGLAFRKNENKKDYEKFLESTSYCPFCGRPLYWDKNHINLVCRNSDCEEVKFQWIVDFFKILGIEETKEDTLRHLYEAGLNSWKRLLRVTKQDLVIIDGWAERSAYIYRKEMDKLVKQGVPFARLCHASGFFGGLGEKTIQLIIDNCRTILNPYPSMNELLSIKGISNISGESFLKGIKMIEEEGFFSPIKILYIESPKKENIDSDKIVCFSGFRDSDLKQRLEDRGFKVEDNLTKKTKVLIVKDKGQVTSKIEKAKKMGILIYSKEEVKDL